jgi:uncharacterized protein YycO
MGKIYYKPTSKEHIFKRYYDIEGLLKVGDIILTKSDTHLSNLTNIGYWKHAMVYVGGKFPFITEAIGEGVVKRTLVEMLASKDRLVVLRPTNKLIYGQNQIDTMVDFLTNQIGKTYDYNFDSFTKDSDSSFYCS